MSIIFGVTEADRRPVNRRDLLSLARSTDKYAPDGTFVHTQGSIGMGFQPYHTHERSHLEKLPLVDARDNILSLDGRLDNHEELCDLLKLAAFDTPDSLIVIRAFECWGEECFSRLIGDWALALWIHVEQTLYLARDHAGSRSLYFEHSNGRVLWSTYLETFFADGRTYDLDDDFTASYLSLRPIRELTPYKAIKAVPPSHYLRFREGVVVSRSHWQWEVKPSIVYSDDAQYEDHFFQLFGQSIQRRTAPGAPILAQLSGGMDSASIVCMSDHIRRSHDPQMDLIDTVSFYDHAEPNWNEFPFFAIVEARRQKTGIHLDASYNERKIRAPHSTDFPQLWPGSDSLWSDLETRLHCAIKGRNFRSVLSGLGGDELLGGVPTPYPELADLMVKGHLLTFSTNGIDWCLANRMPLLHLLLGTLRFTWGLYVTGRSKPTMIPPWLSEALQRRSAKGRREEMILGRSNHRLPSRINNEYLWLSVQETLPTRLVSSEERFEFRYPYLDRDLVEFIFSIPRRQIVEPGRRRSLMRRALRNVVPCEILERRRKAYIIRGPINLIRRERDWIADRFRSSHCVEVGLVDPSHLSDALDSIAIESDPKWLPYLMRLIDFELWLSSEPSKSFSH